MLIVGFVLGRQWRSQEFDWGRGVYVSTSHYNFKTCVPHVNKTVTDFFFGGVYIPIYPPPSRYAPVSHVSLFVR